MLSFDAAQSLFADSVDPVVDTEPVWLGLASGRVLARDVPARLDVPAADKSAMDGYAIRMADWRRGQSFPVQQVCYAGNCPESLAAGHAIRLFTGSLVPQCADTVIADEHAVLSEDTVSFLRAPVAGRNIRRQGEDAQAGSPLLSAGTLLGPGHIAALASQGVTTIPAVRLVEVALLISGDEVAAHAEPQGRHQVHNINGPMLESLVESLGAIVVKRKYVRDEERAVHQALLELVDDADMVLLTGGASGGVRDLAAPALVSAGGELLFHQVNMKPGKPVSVGRLRAKPVVCLPGNPAAAYTTFALLVTPMLRKLQGRAHIYPAVSQVRVDLGKREKTQRDEFWRATRIARQVGYDRAQVHSQQGAASVSALGDAGGFIRVSPQADIAAYDLLPYYDLRCWLS
ncbi:molybdopterin molybdotransferase MoeA [Cupriavidus necator]|uniref:molybdopterin molybdotransferase MoeA n=1 Tax=Cupriavidus necator TaxID=106590 RepID=UPI0005B4D4DC|nr:molybdopterin molybdotransferase MoeA [Cupriavidus necator]